MNCCGAGYYAKQGFLHVDEGRPRFWEPQTSRVEENLSAGNAKLFGRTEFDRYQVGEPIVVELHSMTVPPVMVSSKASFVRDGSDPVELAISGGQQDGACARVGATGMPLRVAGVDRPGRGRVVVSTCEPRVERTPASAESNAVTVVDR
jgi:hypothetical protein